MTRKRPRFERVLIVGCGNMGGAMLEGWLAGGMAAQRFAVLDPGRDAAPPGVRLFGSIDEAGAGFDTVLLGFKPQQLADLAPGLGGTAGPGVTIASILAGVELAALAQVFPEAGARVRVMPNLAAALGMSPIALAADGLDPDGRAALEAFMAPLGQPEWVAEEAFDLVTALAGSGPGFLYRFTGALGDAAVSLGLPPAQAERLAVATVEGAAALASRSGQPPGQLADRVASPGGVTRAGLDVLDDEQALTRLLCETLRAARDRSGAMAAERRVELGAELG